MYECIHLLYSWLLHARSISIHWLQRETHVGRDENNTNHETHTHMHTHTHVCNMCMRSRASALVCVRDRIMRTHGCVCVDNCRWKQYFSHAVHVVESNTTVITCVRTCVSMCVCGSACVHSHACICMSQGIFSANFHTWLCQHLVERKWIRCDQIHSISCAIFYSHLECMDDHPTLHTHKFGGNFRRFSNTPCVYYSYVPWILSEAKSFQSIS